MSDHESDQEELPGLGKRDLVERCAKQLIEVYTEIF